MQCSFAVLLLRLLHYYLLQIYWFTADSQQTAMFGSKYINQSMKQRKILYCTMKSTQN